MACVLSVPGGFLKHSTEFILDIYLSFPQTEQFELLYHKNKFNSLAPERFEWNFIQVIFKLISVSDDWGMSCEIAIR